MATPSPIVYYVYVLLDWRGVPFYVGKGKGRRWEHHERRSDSNHLKAGLIEQTWTMLREIPKVKVREGLSVAEAFATEIALIAALGRIDRGTGCLTNMNDGGNEPGIDAARRGRSTMNAALTPEQRSDRSRKANAARTVEQRRENGRKVVDNTTPEQRRENGRKGHASLTPEQHQENSRRGGIASQAKLTPEQRRENSRKAGVASQASERRPKPFSFTSEQQRENSRKGGLATATIRRSQAT